MSWQEHAYTRLCQAPDEGWLALGELFEQMQPEIPLHFAMRYAVRLTRNGKMPSGIHAQWLYFKGMLNRMHIERKGSGKRWTYADQVRVRPVRERACTHCEGPVVWATWSGRTDVRCLACEAAETTPLAPKREPSEPFITQLFTKARSWWLRTTVRQAKRATGIEMEGQRAPPDAGLVD